MARSLELTSGLALLLASCGAAEPDVSWDQAPPNVLLISVDTLRADHLSHYGYERGTSPQLDAFADSAVVFENTQSSSSWTMPSLASILTSYYSSTHDVWNHSSRLDESHTTLTEYLLPYGYDTASISSAMSMPQGLQQGFVHFDDSMLRPDVPPSEFISSELLSDRAVRFLEQKVASPDELPWFLWLHYFDPHNDFLFHSGISEQFESSEASDEFTAMRDLYDGEIYWTDLHIGRVLGALEQSGFTRDTIVVLVADHGEELGDHGMAFHGHTLYEELTHVPLVIRAPGMEPRRVPELVRTVDILPTILELVGHALPDSIEGRSLVPLMEGEGRQELAAVSELRLHDNSSMESIVSGPWKLVRHIEDGRSFLYDRRADPQEKHDLAAEHPAVVEDLLRQLEGILGRARRIGERYERSESADLSVEQQMALEDLGYAGSDS